MSTHVSRIIRIFVLLVLCASVSGQTSDSEGAGTPPAEPRVEQSSGASSSEYSMLEKQIDSLNSENQALESEQDRLKQENDKAETRLGNQRGRIMVLEGGQRLLNPVRFISPVLANAAFICGTIALLILVLGYPIASRKILSLGFPFNLPVRKRSHEETPPLGHVAQIIWIIILICLLLMLAMPAMAQDAPGSGIGQASEGESGVTAAEATINPGAGDGETGEAIEGSTVPDLTAKEVENPTASVAAGEGEPGSTDAVEGSASNAESSPASAPSSNIQPELNQAVGFINLTPLERALHIIDTLSEGKSTRLTLDNEVLQKLTESAKQHNHLPIAKIPEPPETSITEEVRYGSLLYYFLKASLYEASGRDNVRALLDQGAAPLVENAGAALPGLDMGALVTIMSFLASYQSVDNVKVMIKAALNKVETLSHIVQILEAAQQAGLNEEYQNVVEDLFSARQNYAAVEFVTDLALQHNQKPAAEFVVNSAIKNPYDNLEENLKVVQLLDRIAGKEQVTAQLEALANYKTLDEILMIAQAASDLGLPREEEGLLVKGVSAARNGEDYVNLIGLVQRKNLIAAITRPLGELLASMPDRMLYKIPCAWPEGFNAALYDKEEVSLGVWTGVQLYQQDKTSPQARHLMETTVHLELGPIIDSVGASPLLSLNDMYALVQYYTETGTDGMDTAMQMLALQRHLRGLSDEKVASKDPRLLALQMELDQRTARNRDLTDSVASLKAERDSLARQEAEANMQFLVLTAEICAKIVLLVLALWIAFARAVAAARTAPNFRFSHFCLAFMETVGFECCCTVVLLLPGAVIVLVSQDRLKHLRIMEYALPLLCEAVPGTQPAAVPTADAAISRVNRNPEDQS